MPGVFVAWQKLVQCIPNSVAPLSNLNMLVLEDCWSTYLLRLFLFPFILPRFPPSLPAPSAPLLLLSCSLEACARRISRQASGILHPESHTAGFQTCCSRKPQDPVLVVLHGCLHAVLLDVLGEHPSTPCTKLDAGAIGPTKTVNIWRWLK